jgi:ribosome-associated protein
VKAPRITDDEVEWSAIRAQGAGGQNVNKVSNAAQLRFDVRASRLSDAIQQRLLAISDQRISSDGVVVIKAQDHRSLERNRHDALARLQDLVDRAAVVPRRRIATKPTQGSKRRRLDGKTQRGAIKAQRGKVVD